MRQLSALRNGLGLDGDRCMRDTPTQLTVSLKSIKRLMYFIIILERIMANPCSSRPCQNGGTCQATSDMTFQCTCQVGYIGSTCEQLGKVIQIVTCR